MRRHLPLLGAVLFVASSLFSSRQDYNAAIAAHAWTGASITMGLGVVFAIVAAFLGWFLGKSLRALAEPGGDIKHPALVAAVIILFTAYFSVATALNRKRAARYRELSAEVLTVARARELVADPADKSAVAYNRTCPPDILRELALDPNESVRYYASFHPSFKK